jgi:hypothetical protein
MELNVAMLRNNATATKMADAIKKSRVSFNRKKYGEVPFDANEILALSKELSLTLEQVNVIFFDNELHDGNLKPVQTS